MGSQIRNRRRDIATLVGGADEPQPIPAEMHTDDMAKLMTISNRHLDMLATQGALEKIGPARWDTRATLAGFIAYKSKPGSKSLELEAEKLRLAKEQADKLEIANAKARGDLVGADEVEREWSGALRDIRAAILATPSRIGSRLPHLTAHDIAEVAKELSAALADLSEGKGVRDGND